MADRVHETRFNGTRHDQSRTVACQHGQFAGAATQISIRKITDKPINNTANTAITTIALVTSTWASGTPHGTPFTPPPGPPQPNPTLTSISTSSASDQRQPTPPLGTLTLIDGDENLGDLVREQHLWQLPEVLFDHVGHVVRLVLVERQGIVAAGCLTDLANLLDPRANTRLTEQTHLRGEGRGGVRQRT